MFSTGQFFGLNFSVWNSGHESKIASIGILYCTIFVYFFYWWTAVGLSTLPANRSKTIQRLKWSAHGEANDSSITSYFTQNSKFSCDIVPQNSLKCLPRKGYQQGTDTRRNYNSQAVNYNKKKLHQPDSLDSTRDETLLYSKCPEMYNVQK